jgi:hypothetical protein
MKWNWIVLYYFVKTQKYFIHSFKTRETFCAQNTFFKFWSSETNTKEKQIYWTVKDCLTPSFLLVIEKRLLSARYLLNSFFFCAFCSSKYFFIMKGKDKNHASTSSFFHFYSSTCTVISLVACFFYYFSRYRYSLHLPYQLPCITKNLIPYSLFNNVSMFLVIFLPSFRI